MSTTYIGPSETTSPDGTVFRRKRMGIYPGYSALEREIAGRPRIQHLQNTIVFVARGGATIERVGLTHIEQLLGHSHSPGLTSVATGRGPWTR